MVADRSGGALRFEDFLPRPSAHPLCYLTCNALKTGRTLLPFARFADRVRGWTRRTGSRANLALDYRGSSQWVLGRSLRRGRSRVEACTDAVVVLKWRESESDFFVLTAYPEVRR
jgi:hypothetical protein